MAPRPLLLLTNDDGVNAEGLRALERALAPLGDVITVAPETEQSATSHSITLARPLRMRSHGPARFAVDGTPVDTVYVALHHPTLLPRRPDLVVSGINHGLNLGSDVFYSGTVAAAREAALRGVPALAVSLAGGGDRVLAGDLARAVAASILARDTPDLVLLNLNVPAGDVKGLRACRLGSRLYDDSVDVRTDPRGREYLWIGSSNVSHPPADDSDTAAYEAGYASLTPLSIDLYQPSQRALAERMADMPWPPSRAR